MFPSVTRFLLICLIVPLVSLAVPQQDVRAQRLLQRIQNRIRGRIAPPPNAPPPNAPVPNAPVPNGSIPRTIDPRTGAPVTQLRPGVAPRQGGSLPPNLSESQDTAGNPLPRFRTLRPRSPADAASTSTSTGTSSVDPKLRASLGVSVVAVANPIRGVKVIEFRRGTLARQAGLRVGDVIVMLGERSVADVAELRDALAPLDPQTATGMLVVRGGRPVRLDVPLVAANRLPPPQRRRLPNASGPSVLERPVPRVDDDSAEPRHSSERGPSLTASSALTRQLGLATEDPRDRRGALVADVSPGGAAAAHGIQPGDRIVSVNGRVVQDATGLEAEFQAASDRIAANEAIPLGIVRDQRLITIRFRGNNRPDRATASQPPTRTPDESGKSLLGGVGSMIGGLFGSGQEPSNDADVPTRDAANPLADDEMAFGDGEPLDPPTRSETLPPPANRSDSSPR